MRAAVAAVVASLLGGCAGGPAENVLGEPVPFNTIDQGAHSDIHDRRTVSIRTQPDWEALWREHTQDQIRPPAAPDVDFAHRMLLAAFKGYSPNSCHSAEISRVRHDTTNQAITVDGHWVEIVGGVCAAAVTYPYHMVELDATPGEVRFNMTEKTKPAE